MPKVVWLFCYVIDNFGDVGVSWRLACELRARFGAEVVLFIDDKAALAVLAPDAARAGIRIQSWVENASADVDNLPAPDLLIETFACRLPENVLQIIRENQTLWLNWEYLSAEDWALRTHGMISLQADGFPKYFWQMGFVPESGGLLREPHFRLPENRARAGVCRVLWFGYAGAWWADCVAAWQQLGWAMEIDVFGTQVAQSLGLTAGQTRISGSLKIRCQDFVPQADFDALLAQYDVLFVRGEDSFVRAQFSGKPFFWHIYPQEERAHEVKLAAFWRQFHQGEAAWWRAHQALSDELNGVRTLSLAQRVAHWHTLWENWADWQAASGRWQMFLWNQSDAITRLRDFWQDKRFSGCLKSDISDKIPPV